MCLSKKLVFYQGNIPSSWEIKFLFVVILFATLSWLMFYKQNSFSGRVTSTEATAAYQPQGLGTFKEVKAGPVIEPPNMSSVPSGTNEIRKWQEIFRKTKAPVYLLRGTRDVVMFRGLSAAVIVGLGYTFYNVYLMSTGQMKRKERPS